MSFRTAIERKQSRIPTRFRPQGTPTLESLGISDAQQSGNALAWTNASLQNSWVAYDAANYHTASYTKTPDGVVMIRGFIKDGTATAGTLLFTLPTGYRPSKKLVFITTAQDVDETIEIRSDGTVYLMTNSSAVWLTLSGINFTPD